MKLILVNPAPTTEYVTLRTHTVGSLNFSYEDQTMLAVGFKFESIHRVNDSLYIHLCMYIGIVYSQTFTMSPTVKADSLLLLIVYSASNGMIIAVRRHIYVCNVVIIITRKKPSDFLHTSSFLSDFSTGDHLDALLGIKKGHFEFLGATLGLTAMHNSTTRCMNHCPKP